jgi:hypothetical protein
MESEEELLTAYLLGELPEDRQLEVEERIFTDAAYLESLALRENLLIEQYRRNELPRPNAHDSRSISCNPHGGSANSNWQRTWSPISRPARRQVRQHALVGWPRFFRRPPERSGLWEGVSPLPSFQLV